MKVFYELIQSAKQSALTSDQNYMYLFKVQTFLEITAVIIHAPDKMLYPIFSIKL